MAQAFWMRHGPLLFADAQKLGMNDRVDDISIGGSKEMQRTWVMKDCNRYVVEPRIDRRLGVQQRVGRQNHEFRVGRGRQPAWKLHGSDIDAIYMISHLRS